MVDDVWRWCETRQAFGRTATVKVKYADFQQITRSRSRPAPIASYADLRDISLELIRSVLPSAKAIRLVGVTVSNFEQTAPALDEPQLFEATPA
jgi:DNA polymerase-4